MNNAKPNCFQCKHRRNIPGDAHSQCVHPLINGDGDNDMFSAIIALVDGSAIKAAEQLDIQAEPHGVRSGWFFWPANFDPRWLLNCNGFESKEEYKEEKNG